MGYKPIKKEIRTLNEMSGVEFAELSSGRKVLVRVHTLGTLWKFQEKLSRAALNATAEEVTSFFQYSLWSAEEGFMVKARRALGLPDFSARTIRREVSADDVKVLISRIVEANLGVTFEEYAAGCVERIKKKMEMERTGEKSSVCCCGTGGCGQAKC